MIFRNRADLVILLQAFVGRIKAMSNLTIDYLIMNAGILKYPNVRPFGSQSFEDHC